MIPSPFLLYLGDSQDELSVKTSRGVAVWRPQACVGEFRGPKCDQTLGLPHLGFEEAKAKGARTVIIGVANAGGIMGPSIVAGGGSVEILYPPEGVRGPRQWEALALRTLRRRPDGRRAG